MPKKKNRDGARPVLAAVDFSPHSEAALLWAAGVAHCLRAPLVVLHVVHDLASAPGYYRTKKKGLRRMEEAAEEMMAEFLGHVRKSHPDLEALAKAQGKLVVGLPITRILEVVEKLDAQLLAVGSQGRTGLPHLLLGSKAERLAQLAPIPVTIVKVEKKKQKRKD